MPGPGPWRVDSDLFQFQPKPQGFTMPGPGPAAALRTRASPAARCRRLEPALVLRQQAAAATESGGDSEPRERV